MDEREKVGRGFWTSDWLGGDEVLAQIHSAVRMADYYRRLLYHTPEDVLHPYFIELRIIYSKISPLLNEKKTQEYDAEIARLKDRVDEQIVIFQRQLNSLTNPNSQVELNAQLAEDLQLLQDDLLRVMQKSHLWIPASYSKDAQAKKKDYFGTSGKRSGGSDVTAKRKSYPVGE